MNNHPTKMATQVRSSTSPAPEKLAGYADPQYAAVTMPAKTSNGPATVAARLTKKERYFLTPASAVLSMSFSRALELETRRRAAAIHPPKTASKPTEVTATVVALVAWAAGGGENVR